MSLSYAVTTECSFEFELFRDDNDDDDGGPSGSSGDDVVFVKEEPDVPSVQIARYVESMST